MRGVFNFGNGCVEILQCENKNWHIGMSLKISESG
jgi:hypothetical protein